MLPLKYRQCHVLNEEVKYKHDECVGNTGNLYVRYGYKEGKLGWHYFCQSCGRLAEGLSGFFSTDIVSSPSETLKQLQEIVKSSSETLMISDLALPDDITYTLPKCARKYMLKYDLSEEEIKLSNFGWSSYLDRLIMPVYQDYNLVYWQGRNLGAVTASRPKYKNIFNAGSRSVFAKFNRRDGKESDTVVLVEAIISAVKLSRHVDCISLLGSYIPNSILKQIRQYKHVLIWLDPDKISVSITESIRLGMLSGHSVRPVLSDKKPKQYNNKEILCHLNL